MSVVMESVTKKYRGITALSGVSMTLTQGVTGLLGVTRDRLDMAVQLHQGLFSLARKFTCPGQKRGMIRKPHLRTGGAVSGRTAAQERYPRHHIAIFDLHPPAIDRSQRTPEGATLFGRH